MNARKEAKYLANQASEDLAKALSSIDKMNSHKTGSIDYHNTRDDAKSYLEKLMAHSFDFSKIEADDANMIRAFMERFYEDNPTRDNAMRSKIALSQLKIPIKERG